MKARRRLSRRSTRPITYRDDSMVNLDPPTIKKSLYLQTRSRPVVPGSEFGHDYDYLALCSARYNRLLTSKRYRLGHALRAMLADNGGPSFCLFNKRGSNDPLHYFTFTAEVSTDKLHYINQWVLPFAPYPLAAIPPSAVADFFESRLPVLEVESELWSPEQSPLENRQPQALHYYTGHRGLWPDYGSVLYVPKAKQAEPEPKVYRVRVRCRDGFNYTLVSTQNPASADDFSDYMDELIAQQVGQNAKGVSVDSFTADLELAGQTYEAAFELTPTEWTEAFHWQVMVPALNRVETVACWWLGELIRKTRDLFEYRIKTLQTPAHTN